MRPVDEEVALHLLRPEDSFRNRKASMPPHRSNTNASLANQTGWLGGLARLWQRTYAPDYVGLVVLVIAYIVLEVVVKPFHQMFSLDDIRIQYPHARTERVPLSWLFGYAGAIPLIVIIVWIAASRSGSHKMQVTILGYFIGVFLTTFITDVIKNAVGRPRPDLLARCAPRKGTPQHTLVDYDVCTEANRHILHDGWRSFPSGHSSFAFSGLGFLALFLAGQMHIFRPNGDLTRGLVALAPLLGAALIAISRCEDKHDVYDVCAGSLLGIVIAYWSYRRFYPRLRDANCAVPFASRCGMEGFSKLRDDEEHTVQSTSTFAVGDQDSEDESGNHPRL